MEFNGTGVVSRGAFAYIIGTGTDGEWTGSYSSEVCRRNEAIRCDTFVGGDRWENLLLPFPWPLTDGSHPHYSVSSLSLTKLVQSITTFQKAIMHH